MIPVMDDPLVRHWRQPRDIRDAPMDEKLVLLTPRQFDELPEYSTTMPTGVYPGKCWKRIERNRDGSVHRTLLVWYGDETPDHKCPILFRDIDIVHPTGTLTLAEAEKMRDDFRAGHPTIAAFWKDIAA